MKYSGFKMIKLFFNLFAIEGILCAIMLSLPYPSIAQKMQYVRIYEYIPSLDSKTGTATKVPLPNVEVSVVGAGTTATDSNGECTLRFNTMTEGDRIVVRRIARSGYEIKDRYSIGDLVIRRDGEPIEILMMSQENILKVSQYYEKLVQTQFEKQKTHDLVKLDPFAADYEQKREEIQRKYESKLDVIEEYIDRLCRIDMTNISSKEKESFKAFMNGDIDLALQFLERSNLLEKYHQTLESLHRVKNAHEKIDNVRNEELGQMNAILDNMRFQISLLELDGSEENSRKAKQLLECMLDINPAGNYQVRTYMSLIIELRDFHYADSTIRHNIKAPGLPNYRFCRMASNLGTILYEQARYDEAWEYLFSIEERQQKLIDENPNDPIPYFHRLVDQHILGQICMHRKDNNEALRHFREAFNTYMNLRDVDATKKNYAPASYPCLSQIVGCLLSMKQYEFADSVLSVAMPRVEFLFANGNFKQRYTWVNYKVMKAVYYNAVGRTDEAFALFSETIPEMERIYQTNHSICEVYYKKVLHNWVRLQRKCNRVEDVSSSIEKWFSVREGIQSKKTFHQDTTDSIADLCTCVEMLTIYAYQKQIDNEELDKVESCYRRAISYIENNEEIAAKQKSYHLVCLVNLATLLYDNNQILESQEFARKALTIDPDCLDARILLGLN